MFASKKFTAEESAIIIKILIKHDIFPENWKAKMEKFNIKNSTNINCECKGGVDSFIHRIKNCKKSSKYARKIKDLVKEDW